MELLGVVIDNKLNFNEHITNVCKKVNNQFNVMLRFRNLVSRNILLKLYKAFILPHFNYCSTIWHFCTINNRDKLETLNKRILRSILLDDNSSYEQLLKKSGTLALYSQRL